MFKKLVSLFKKDKGPVDRILPRPQVMQEAYDRIKEAREKIANCPHKNRVAHKYDHETDEVMCLDCGLIKLIDRVPHQITKYTSEDDLPEILKNKAE